MAGARPNTSVPPGFVEFEQVDAVGEDLAALQEPKRANHYWLWRATIDHGASANGDFGLALAVHKESS